MIKQQEAAYNIAVKEAKAAEKAYNIAAAQEEFSVLKAKEAKAAATAAKAKMKAAYKIQAKAYEAQT